MLEYCEKCNRCHEEGLRDDEECRYYGEPCGCNHPDYGFEELPDNPTSVADMLDRKIIELNEALELKNAQVVSLLARIKDLEDHQCEYAIPNHGCMEEDKHFHKTVELERNVALLERALKPVMECRIERIDGLDSPDGEFMTSSEYGVCDSDGNEVDNHSIASSLNAVREAQRVMREGCAK